MCKSECTVLLSPRSTSMNVVGTAIVEETLDDARQPRVYLLQSTVRPRRTYVGCTCCGVDHRLRQHNGEVRGGARQTQTARPWVVRTVVAGFRTRREALQFEFAWRRVHRKGRHVYSVRGRRNSLSKLCAMVRWSRNAPPAAEVPLTISHHDDA